jgi:hypothetical protein
MRLSDFLRLENEHENWLAETCDCESPEDYCDCLDFSDWMDFKEAEAIDRIA